MPEYFKIPIIYIPIMDWLILLDVTHDTIDLIPLFGGWPTMAMLNNAIVL